MVDINIYSHDSYFRSGIEGIFTRFISPYTYDNIQSARTNDFRYSFETMNAPNSCEGEIEFIFTSSRPTASMQKFENCQFCCTHSVYIDADLSVAKLILLMHSSIDRYLWLPNSCNCRKLNHHFTALETRIISLLKNGLSFQNISRILKLD